MSEYSARIHWQRGQDEVFTDNKYSRGHHWHFDGGEVVAASASPHIVPLPLSVEANVDPEEAFVAALSSCHMLFFLHIASEQGFVVEDYDDNAIGVLGQNDKGQFCMTNVTLRPTVRFSGNKRPSQSLMEKMHHESHQQCFIANSVTTEVVTEIQ